MKNRILIFIIIAIIFTLNCGNEIPDFFSLWGPILGYNLYDGPYAIINSVKFHPEDEDIIYAFVVRKGVYKTEDGGSTWVAINNGLDFGNEGGDFTHCTFNGIKIDPNNSEELYVPFGGKIFKTTNGGNIWEEKSEGTFMPGYEGFDSIYAVNDITIDQNNSLHLYCGTIVGDHHGGVFESWDGADHWTQIAGTNIPGSGIGNDAYDITLDPHIDGRMYALGVHEAIWISSDSGHHWKREEPNITPYGFGSDCIYLWKDTPGKMLLSTFVDTCTPSLYISYDYGETWDIYRDDWRWFFTSIKSCRDDNSYIYAVSGIFGLYRSADNGETWRILGHDTLGLRTIDVHPKNPQCICIGTYSYGIFISKDGGETLFPINSNLPEK